METSETSMETSETPFMFEHKMELNLKELHYQSIDILSHFPKNYLRKQISTFRSDENVVFELQKKKTS